MTLAKMRGALPSAARPYRVRDAMYRSELAALSTNMRMQALITWFRVLIPARVLAVNCARSDLHEHTNRKVKEGLTNDEGRGSGT